MAEIVSCIHQVPVFRVLPQDSVERLQGIMQHSRMEPGDTVLRMGDTLHRLVVVVRGRLKLSRTSKNGREQIIRELGPGHFFGEMALFTEVQSEGDLVAMEPTHVCMLERGALQTELQKTPHVNWLLVEMLARRLAEAERLVGDLSLLDVSERLASELLRLAQSGRPTSQGIRVELPFAWAQLATRLGTTPESLSRRLRDFSEAGWVQADGRHLLIRDMDRLREVVDGVVPNKK